MIYVEQIQSLFEYNFALYDRVWDSINQLTDEQFMQEIPYSHGSVRNQMVHVASTERRWLRGLKEIPGPRASRLDPADYPTRQIVRQLWETTSQEVLAYVASLDEAACERVPEGFYGPVWQVLLHLVNHGTDHRAQILRALHDFGAPTFDQDLILHLWRR